ncbi:FCD domain-containing protein, partial [Rhizobium ruizarguesonis]|uniref:FCD domain-containing protein n=1 Tax=Rhizobium ruizarguesonis TaxID=2081791 RepID=UPI001FEEA4E8
IYEIRGALEGMAARLCAERRSPEIVAALEESLAGIRNSYRDNALTGGKRCPVGRVRARQIKNLRLGLNCVLAGTNLTLIYYG